MTILIITGQDDVHADAVIPRLETTTAVIRLNTDNVTENISFAVHQNEAMGELHILDADRTVNLRDITSVWYRKPVPVRSDAVYPFEAVRSFVTDEYESFLRSLNGLLSDRFWVSDYWKIRMASQKLLNLRVASSLGLSIPKTIVTNRIEDARDFAAMCSWDVLVKPFALTTFKPSEAGLSWDSFAARLNHETFEALAPSLQLAPTMLQRYIDKRIELRVTVVGRHVFCTSIDSQGNEFSQHDWRAVDVEDLQHRPFVLPPEVEDKLLAFNRHFGLQFSTFDLIVDKNGEYVWLECNPNGQWLWVEHLTGVPISDAIKDLLIQPAPNALMNAQGGYGSMADTA